MPRQNRSTTIAMTMNATIAMAVAGSSTSVTKVNTTRVMTTEAIESQTIQRFAPVARRLDEDPELRTDLLLADVVGELLGPQRPLERLLLGGGALGCDETISLDHAGAIRSVRGGKQRRRPELRPSQRRCARGSPGPADTSAA